MTYLLSKGKIRIHNEYVGDTYNWILVAYPWSTAKTLWYLYENTIFKYINDKNIFENCFYNLEKKVLYDHKKIDLDEYMYE
jgi:trans-2-enoyl-CoA reductase